MGVCGGDDNKYVINKHFDKLSLSNLEDSKICEVGHFSNFHFKHFLVDQFKPKLVQSKNRKKLYYTTYTINIPIII